MEKQYHVYILTNKNNRVLYTGITNDLLRRTFEHKNKLCPGFTKKYNVYKLIYYEIFTDPISAISREKQIKSGSRKDKISLIESNNAGWDELYDSLI